MSSENWGGSRPGSGRPSELGESKLVSFDCSLDLLEELTAEAKIRGKKRADFIRDLLKKGLRQMQNVTITASHVELAKGHHRNVIQQGNTVSFKAKDQGKFGPLGIQYYLLTDNTVIYRDDPGALPGLSTSIGTHLGDWKDLQKTEGVKPNEWQKDANGHEWGVLGLSYEKK